MRYAQRWIVAKHDQPRPWREAADFSDVMLTLSPHRLRALNDELWRVILRYRDEEPQDEPGARQVLLFLSAFPRIEESR